MKYFSALIIAGGMTLLAISSAVAGTASGTTTILGPAAPNAITDTPTSVEVTINTTAPVVPFEYSLVNRCWFDGKTSGPSDSFERFALTGPWSEPSPGDPPTTVETVNVQPVPAGAKCKVNVVKNNTAVKGSTTTYSVVP